MVPDRLGAGRRRLFIRPVAPTPKYESSEQQNMRKNAAAEGLLCRD